MQSPPSIVEARGLVRSFGNLQVVRGVDLDVLRGEVFGLLGPNGAGKSTTISILTGMIAPSGGTISVCGFDLLRQPDEVKRRIGLVPQELALYPTLSPTANLRFFGRIYGLHGKQLQSRVDWALEVAGLTERRSDPVGTFSGGMQRRLNLAAGLIHRPEILFLDEPTVGVDPQSRNHIFDCIEQLNGEGMTVVYTTHYMEEAERLCDRIGILDAGRIIALDTPERLLDRLGGVMVRLSLDGAEALVEPLSAIEGVTACRIVEDGALEIECSSLDHVLARIVLAVDEQGSKIKGLQVTERNLEEVFLHLTGRRLRD
jgi:ABC-2 type transport system ATP-binding protein